MAENITLTNLVNLTNQTTAVNAINSNNAVITNAFKDVLSLSGQAPNQMAANLDMNNNQILNLPSPLTGASPLRLQDAATLNGGGTIASIPVGGTAGQVLTKNSSNNFDTSWNNTAGTGTVTNVALSLPADFTVTGSPVTSSGTLTGAWATTPTGSGAVVRTTSPTLVTPVIASIVNTGTLTLPTVTDTLVARTTTDTLTNKTFDTAGAGNVFKINGTQITANTGTGNNVLATTPTLTTPILGAATATTINGSTVSPGQYSGTTTNDNATTGNIGEFISASIATGSSLSLTTATPVNITSISLTAGDWDVWGAVEFTVGATTSVTNITGAINTVGATLPAASLTGTGTSLYSFTQVAEVPGNTFNPAYVAPLAMTRISIASTTTVFLITQASFTASTMNAYGFIAARRAR